MITFVYRYISTALLGSGILLYETRNKAEMAKRRINISEFMTTPITDVNILESNSGDMKSKMELMIMKIQV